jgi:hypothetical protein
MKTISEIIEARLSKFNSAHPGISTNPKNRIGKAVDTLNRNLDKISIEVNGQDFNSALIVKIPNCFKKAPLVWRCLGSDIALELYQ